MLPGPAGRQSLPVSSGDCCTRETCGVNKNDSHMSARAHGKMAPQPPARHGSRCWTGWADSLPEERLRVYQAVWKAAGRHAIPFALGGAFATATHTERRRDTNDMDLYTLPQYREKMKELLEGEMRLRDIYDEFPYHRDWTYRATNGQTIVEVIWSMKNHRAEVDQEWIHGWGEIEVRGMRVFVTPPEEMMWAKLYVLHRLRSDWPDVLNYLYVCGPGLDWERLLRRLGPDARLLTGAVAVFSWLSPERSALLPEWIWKRLGLRRPGRDKTRETAAQRGPLLFEDQHVLSEAISETQASGRC
jgi:hypothetical protein